MKRVIDAETMKLIETFSENETEKILLKYRSMDKWEYVELDYDGDIILNND